MNITFLWNYSFNVEFSFIINFTFSPFSSQISKLNVVHHSSNSQCFRHVIFSYIQRQWNWNLISQLHEYIEIIEILKYMLASMYIHVHVFPPNRPHKWKWNGNVELITWVFLQSQSRYSFNFWHSHTQIPPPPHPSSTLQVPKLHVIESKTFNFSNYPIKNWLKFTSELMNDKIC